MTPSAGRTSLRLLIPVSAMRSLHPTRSLAPLVLLLLGLSGGACTTEPPKPVVPARPRAPEDSWQRSAIWLHATSDAKGGASKECEHVLGKLEGESVCKGQLCADAAELASEWLDKCAARHGALAEDVRALQTSYRERKDDPATDCSRELEELLRDGCAVSGCVQRAQAWLTKCADAEAGPLAVSKLVTTVERAVGPDEEVSLDPRSCMAIAKAVQAGASCKDEPSCQALEPEIDAYTTRCLSTGVTPTLETGLAMFAVMVATGKTPEPLFVSSPDARVKPDSFPLVLEDGTGAVLAVCGRRMVDREEYFAARGRCLGSPLTFVLLDVLQGGSRQLHVGSMPVPDEATLARLYPGLRVAGEREQAEAAALAAAKSELEPIWSSPGSVSGTQLATLLDRHSDAIVRSEELRKSLATADGALVPLLRRLGEAKTASLRTSRDVLLLRGALFRARKRALADVSLDGSIGTSTVTRAGMLDTSRLWPEATAAHAAALVPIERALRVLLRPSDSAIDEYLDRARAQASACGGAETERLGAERDLRACLVDGCDDTRRQELAARWEKARAARDGARRELYLALSCLESTPEDSQISTIPACLPPKW